MMLRHSLWLACALAIAACGSKPAASPSRLHSPSGVSGGSYDDIIAHQRDLAARYPGLVRLQTYGQSVEGRPLTLVTVGHADAAGPRDAVALTQAIHGDEYLGIADHLADEFLGHPEAYPAVKKFLDAGGLFYIVPVVNPDGYTAGERENSAGKDLNRDFDVERYAGRLAAAKRGEISYSDDDLAEIEAYVGGAKLTQPETRDLAEALPRRLAADHAALRLSIDYHCCQDDTFGSLMHEWGDTHELHDGTISATDVPRYEKAAALFKARFPGHLWGSGYQIVQYLTFGTTDEWFYESNAASQELAFCYEGQGEHENEKLAQHAHFWDDLLAAEGSR